MVKASQSGVKAKQSGVEAKHSGGSEACAGIAVPTPRHTIPTIKSRSFRIHRGGIERSRNIPRDEGTVMTNSRFPRRGVRDAAIVCHE